MFYSVLFKYEDGRKVPLKREEHTTFTREELEWNNRRRSSIEEELYRSNPLLRFLIRELSVHTNETEAALILRYRRELLTEPLSIRPPFYFEPTSDEQFFYFYIPDPMPDEPTPRAR